MHTPGKIKNLSNDQGRPWPKRELSARVRTRSSVYEALWVLPSTRCPSEGLHQLVESTWTLKSPTRRICPERSATAFRSWRNSSRNDEKNGSRGRSCGLKMRGRWNWPWADGRMTLSRSSKVSSWSKGVDWGTMYCSLKIRSTPRSFPVFPQVPTGRYVKRSKIRRTDVPSVIDPGRVVQPCLSEDKEVKTRWRNDVRNHVSPPVHWTCIHESQFRFDWRMILPLSFLLRRWWTDKSSPSKPSRRGFSPPPP